MAKATIDDLINHLEARRKIMGGDTLLFMDWDVDTEQMHTEDLRSEITDEGLLLTFYPT